MQLVEQHVIRRSDPRFAPIDAAAFKAKNLYNAALYLVRQAFIFENRYLGYEDVYHQMKGHDAYRALPTKVAQQVLRLLDKNWQSYFAACEAYREDPSKFRKHPKLPPRQAQARRAVRPRLHHASAFPTRLEAGADSAIHVTHHRANTAMPCGYGLCAYRASCRLLCGGSGL
jgi:hypothetical protein